MTVSLLVVSMMVNPCTHKTYLENPTNGLNCEGRKKDNSEFVQNLIIPTYPEDMTIYGLKYVILNKNLIDT